MSLPAPNYAIQVDPKWNNVPVDAIEVEAAVGSPASDQTVILWDPLSESNQQALMDVYPGVGSPPSLRAGIEEANLSFPITTIRSVYPRPAAPINTNDAYYDGSWKKVYDDSAV